MVMYFSNIIGLYKYIAILAGGLHQVNLDQMSHFLTYSSKIILVGE